MRLLVLLLITFLPPLYAQQSDAAESDDQDAPSSAESESSPGPTVREDSGVVIISSRSESPIVEEEILDEVEAEAEGSEAEQEPAETETDEQDAPDGEIAIEEESVQGEVAVTEEAEEETEVEGPSSRSETVTVFDFSGNRIRQPGSQFSRRSEDGSEKHVTLQSISGREVPYFSERETVLRQTETEKSVEKTTQRYDPNGNPTQQEMVREETRKLADGTVVTTATSSVENING